ncbi:unnamed protein product [Victoria cruziana]
MAGSHVASLLSSSAPSLLTGSIAVAAPAAGRPRSLAAATGFTGFRDYTGTKAAATGPSVSLVSSGGFSRIVRPLDQRWQQRNEKRVVSTPSSSGGAEHTAAEELEPQGVAQLKRALIDSFYGTELGLKASSETRAEIVEFIVQLEGKNPTAAPTETLRLLDGKWILAYTSFSELFPLLATGLLPLVKVEKISQTIDSDRFTVENSVQFSGPLGTTSFITHAKFEIRSPKRVQIKFEEGVIGTPQITDSIVIPEHVELLGQNISLSPLQRLLAPVQHAAASVARTVSEQPPLKFPIASERAQSWLLTTYLDHDLRISRGDGSSIFVLIKEGSPLLV